MNGGTKEPKKPNEDRALSAYPTFRCPACGWTGPETRVVHTAGGEVCERCGGECRAVNS